MVLVVAGENDLMRFLEVGQPGHFEPRQLVQGVIEGLDQWWVHGSLGDRVDAITSSAFLLAHNSWHDLRLIEVSHQRGFLRVGQFLYLIKGIFEIFILGLNLRCIATGVAK